MQNPGGGASKKGCACGMLGCGGGVIGILAFVGLIVYFTMFSNSCARMMGEETYPISSEPTKFDPIAALPEIRKRVGDGSILVTMDASSVRSDGTLNLNADYKPAPDATYSFHRVLSKAPEGQTAPPIGAGRGPDDVWVESITVRVYRPGERRFVRRVSGSSSSSYSYRNEGMDVDRTEARMMKPGKETGVDNISIKQMWEVATKLGAKPDSVARIQYNEDRCEFSITGTGIDIRWDGQGKLQPQWLDDDEKKKLGIVD